MNFDGHYDWGQKKDEVPYEKKPHLILFSIHDKSDSAIHAISQ